MYILFDESILNPTGDLKPQTVSELASVIFSAMNYVHSPVPWDQLKWLYFPWAVYDTS